MSAQVIALRPAAQPDAPGTPAETGVAPDPEASALIGALALMYLRHDDAPRALALGLAAMQRARVPPPRLILLVASAFLRTGAPEQAVAVLSRLDNPGRPNLPGGQNGPDGLSDAISDAEARAVAVLRAKAAFRTGDTDAARTWLAEALGPSSLTEPLP